MNFKERFSAIRDFLGPYNELLRIETIKRHPRLLPDPLEEWIDSLLGAQAQDLLRLENERDGSKSQSPSFRHFLKVVSDLCAVKSFEGDAQALPETLLRQVKLKKRHELERANFLADQIESASKEPLETVIDIGGGAGHLSSCLVHDKERKAYCLDKNAYFQAQGRKRLERWSPEDGQKVSFITASFDEHYSSKPLEALANNLVAGLHGCGGLTTDILRFYLKSESKHLISVGCCYQDIGQKYNISSLAKDGLIFSKNALHLAARCHAFKTLDEMERKLKVRSYRYGLHYRLYEYQDRSFAPIGNTALSDYELSFGAYAKKHGKLKEADIAKLNAFYNDSWTQKKIYRTILGDIIRALLGRVVELYIVLDRAVFLEEAGCSVDVVQAFDRQLSPRNLMILARK